jgi:hypothetical protein
MKLILPKNIYTKIFAEVIKKYEQVEIIFKEASLIAKELHEDTLAIGLIPSLELSQYKTFFVSSKAGISFDGLLSNSYFYLSENDDRQLGQISICGDVSINEVILSKILFKERFSYDVEISLNTKPIVDKEKNTLVVGDENISSWEYGMGISFSDQIAEMLDLPYVNFVFASQDKETIENFNLLMLEIDALIENSLPEIFTSLDYPEAVNEHIKNNFGTVYYELTPNETEALEDLFKLLYYHGIISDMFDIKFI